jgi:hypothetical protein
VVRHRFREVGLKTRGTPDAKERKCRASREELVSPRLRVRQGAGQRPPDFRPEGPDCREGGSKDEFKSRPGLYPRCIMALSAAPQPRNGDGEGARSDNTSHRR